MFIRLNTRQVLNSVQLSVIMCAIEKDYHPYGWFDLLSFLLPWRVSWSGSDFCSEVIAASFGLPEPWHTSPGTLYDWAMAQDGARIVPDEELRARWVAE